jgi:hypothetical protein
MHEISSYCNLNQKMNRFNVHNIMNLVYMQHIYLEYLKSLTIYVQVWIMIYYSKSSLILYFYLSKLLIMKLFFLIYPFFTSYSQFLLLFLNMEAFYYNNEYI